MRTRNEAFGVGEREHAVPCRRTVPCATHAPPIREVDDFLASLAHLCDEASVPVVAPARRLVPLTLPTLRPRSVRTQPPPTLLPPRTFPKVELRAAAVPVCMPIEDSVTLGTTMFPPRPRWGPLLAGVTLLGITCLVTLGWFSSVATSRTDSTPDARAAFAPALAQETRPAAEVLTLAGSATPAPTCAVSASLLPRRAPLSTGPHKAWLPVAEPSHGREPVVTSPRAVEKPVSHRLFGVED